MTMPIITAFYAGLLAILLVALGMWVVRTRVRERVALGDGGKPAMITAIRIHGNAAETIPLGLLLLLLLELTGGSAVWLHVWGSLLVAGRVAHVWGLSRERKVNPARKTGMVLTWLSTLGLAISLLLRAAPQL
ncbi:MAG: MAPEG family protein [Pseudomonadota bacterium]